MENSGDPASFLEKICYPVERYLIGYTIKDKERLVSAIISNALLNEPGGFEQLTKIAIDKSLETTGDFVLDFVIFDHFAVQGHCKRNRRLPPEIWK